MTGVNGGVCEGECLGRSPGDESLTMTRCHSCGLPQLYETLERWKSLWPNLQLKGGKIKKKIFLFFLVLLPFCCLSFHGVMNTSPMEVGC